MQQRTWYQKFEAETVEPTFRPFLNSQALIDNQAVHDRFLTHAKQILQYYQADNKPVGNLPHYLNGIEIANNAIPKMGLFKLLNLTKSYVFNKLIGKEIELPGELGRAITVVKSHNKPSPNGKKPLLQVTSEAECDFIRLIKCYVEFYVLPSARQAKYNKTAIQMSLKIPKLDSVVKSRLEKFDLRVKAFQKTQGAAPAVIEAAPIIKTRSKLLPIASLISDQQLEKANQQLEKAKMSANAIIHQYLQHNQHSWFKAYGRNRAAELQYSLRTASTLKDFDAIKTQFLTDGKTLSDYKRSSFFSSIHRCSSRADANSLRGMFIAGERKNPRR